jgi:O-antigen ligase
MNTYWEAPARRRSHYNPEIISAGPAAATASSLVDRPRSGGVAPAVTLAFCAFIGAIPYESMDIGINREVASLSKLIGYLFLLVALLHPRVPFRRPPLAFWCFAFYQLIVLTMGALQAEEHSLPILERLMQQCQMLVLFWLASNLLQDDRVATGMLLALALSCSFLAVLQLAGITARVASSSGRLTVLNENLNNAGAILSLGLLAWLVISYGRERAGFWAKLCALGGIAALVIPIVNTGSRGALLALGAGILVFVMRPGTLLERGRTLLISLICIAGFVLVAAHSELARDRWHRAVSNGDMSERQILMPNAWAMFLERPLFGWGPVQHLVELGRRTGYPLVDTHNLSLWILTETGLLGGIPFFVGIWLCFQAAWRARSGPHGSGPLAMLATVLVYDLSCSWQNHKLHWVILAYALASGQWLLARSGAWGSLFGARPAGGGPFPPRPALTPPGAWRQAPGAGATKERP